MYISTAGTPTIWALRYEDYWKRPLSAFDLIRILMLHALQVNQTALSLSDYPITVASFRDAEDENNWYALLARSLRGISSLYLVLDAELLAHMTQDCVLRITKLLEDLHRSLSFTAVKIIVPAMAVDGPYVRSQWDLFSWRRIQLDGIVASARRSLTIQRRRKRRRRC